MSGLNKDDLPIESSLQNVIKLVSMIQRKHSITRFRSTPRKLSQKKAPGYEHKITLKEFFYLNASHRCRRRGSFDNYLNIIVEC